MPKGENQKTYVDYLGNQDIHVIVGLGPAGCGKTLFACHAAVYSLIHGNSDRIVITRPLVTADEELGFLPGSMSQKMDPWVRPIFDIFGEFYTTTQIKDMMKTGVIEISPLAYMRGRTFKRSFIIADEMQNSTPNQMLMMLTRVGEGSKLAVTGDLMQSDLKNGGMNGLEDFIKKYRNYGSPEDGPIRYIEMRSEDVQRSEVVSKILDIYKQPVNTNTNTQDKKKEMPVNDDAALIPKKHISQLFEL
jgi:phosphate starvation-inducible PhoH-like protein